MTYNLNPDLQQPIRDMMREFCPKEIEPLGLKHDREPDGFAHDIFQKLVYKYQIPTKMPIFTPEKITKEDRQMRLF